MSRDITLLHPELQQKIKELEKLCEQNGLKFKTTDALRTKAHQDELYAKGRTTEGNIVTNVKYPHSYHCWGIAVDFCQNISGKAFDDSAGFFGKVGKLAQSIGLEWGGAWTGFVDKPHLQLSTFGDTRVLVEKYDNPSKFFDTWEDIKGETYMFVDRAYLHNGKTRSFNVISEKGENYIKIRDLAGLLELDIAYDNNTKTTEMLHNINTQEFKIDDKNVEIPCVKVEGSNFANVREIAKSTGYNTHYNEETGHIELQKTKEF